MKTDFKEVGNASDAFISTKRNKNNRDGPYASNEGAFSKRAFEKQIDKKDKIKYRSDDELSDFIIKRKKETKLSDKEVRQKAYFKSRLESKESDKKPLKTDEIISPKRVKDKNTVRVKGTKVSFDRSFAFDSVKYHVSEVSNYERSNEEKEDLPVSVPVPIYKTKYQVNNKSIRRVGQKESLIKREDEKTVRTHFKKREEYKANGKSIKEKLIKKAEEIFKKNKVVILAVAILVIAIFSIVSAIGTSLEAVSEGTLKIFAGISSAGDRDMTDTDAYFTELEAALQYKIDHIEELRPGFDVYITDTDELGHDAFILMSYLSSVHDGYELNSVKSELDSLFNDLYEVKYEESKDKNNKKTLKMTVRKKDLKTIAYQRMDDEQKDLYKMFDDTGGGHQVYVNPVPTNWKDKISSPFGMRIHPISGKEKFHKGVDIALPTGTPVRSCSKGTVIKSYYSSSAGNYIVIRDSSGYEIHYMHLSERNVEVGAEVTTDTIIGKVGSTGNSTGPHLHLGITDKNGNYLNPVFLVSGGE